MARTHPHLDVILAHDLPCEGIQFGIGEEGLALLASRCGNIEDPQVRSYLLNDCPIWPARQIEERFVRPDLLDYATIIAEMDEFIPSCFLRSYGYLPVHTLPNGDIHVGTYYPV